MVRIVLIVAWLALFLLGTLSLGDIDKKTLDAIMLLFLSGVVLGVAVGINMMVGKPVVRDKNGKLPAL